MLLIPQSMVDEIIKMNELIPIIEQSQIEYSQGKCIQPDKRGVELGERIGLLEVFVGYLSKSETMGVKILNSRKKNPANGRPLIYANITLIDSDTGEPIALIEGGSVTASRTAAASAVATRYLSRENSETLALIGTGRQGRTHLESILEVRPIIHVSIYDINPASAISFKQESESKYDIEIDIAPTIEHAVRESDIVQLCTTTKDPVVFGDWISTGTHVNSIASYAPTVREVDTEFILKAKVVTDSRLDALKGAGELVIPMSEGLIRESHLYAEIGEIASGAKTGRSNDEEITFYKSMGMAVQDVVAANYIWKKALAANLGRQINLYE